MATAIRQFRHALGQTQQQFATTLGLSMTSVARYETNSVPSRAILAHLASVAKERGFPFFATLFEDRVEPTVYINAQQFFNSCELLKIAVQSTPPLPPSKATQVMFALACLLLREEEIELVEAALKTALSRAEEFVDQVSGEILKTADPDLEAIYVQFLKDPSESNTHAYLKKFLADHPEASKLSVLVKPFPKGPIKDEASARKAFEYLRFAISVLQTADRFTKARASDVQATAIGRFLHELQAGTLPIPQERSPD